jgi:hypothetical protein
MFAILSAAVAAILLWGYMRLSDVHSADQGAMPVVAEVIETML